LWDADSGQPIGKPIHHGSRIRSAVFSPDGSTILTGGAYRDAELPSRSSPLGVSKLEKGPYSSALADNNDFGVKIWSTSTQGAIGLPLDQPYQVVSVAFSPDGTKIATSRAFDYVTQVWDLASWRAGSAITLVGPAIKHHRGWVWSMAFSPDGKRLLTGSLDSSAQQWNVETGQPIGATLSHPDEVKGVAYSPDGKTILTGCKEGTVRIWDATTGKSLGPPLRHPGPVASIAFHPDGRSFAAGSSGNTIRLWPVPQPMAGSVERLRLWAQVITGMEMSAEGNLTVLDATEWQARHNRLEEQGRE
jgi:WD40 repeat protein